MVRKGRFVPKNLKTFLYAYITTKNDANLKDSFVSTIWKRSELEMDLQ